MKTKMKTHNMECLENRQLMAANAFLEPYQFCDDVECFERNTLVVVATDQSEIITVDNAQVQQLIGYRRNGWTFEPFYMDIDKIQVQVSDRSTGQTTLNKYFDPSSVDKLRIDAFGGNDRVYNNVARRSEIDGGRGYDSLFGGELRDTIRGGDDQDFIEGRGSGDDLYGDQGTDRLYGGEGNDVLHGGSQADRLYGQGGDDWLYGESGSDWLYGSSGDDWLEGGTGNDNLQGDADKDTLKGEAGDDTLRGGSGNDRLLGGDDDDVLVGEAGADMLYGGPDLDHLYGGAGPDRFLNLIGDRDVMPDKSSADARVNFASGAPQLTDRGVFLRGTWEESEIETVDAALEVLFNATGTNKLLKTVTGSELTFYQVIAVETKVGGWNSGNGQITVLEDNLTNSLIFHEVGHNWDSDYYPTWNNFTSISGWMEYPFGVPVVEGYSRANDRASGDPSPWIYESEAPFVSNYARTNPREDFAETFEAYMNVNFLGASSGYDLNNIDEKFDYIQDFIV